MNITISSPPARTPVRLSSAGPALASGRAHEASGPARAAFAALVAGRMAGPVLWIVGGRCGWRVGAGLDPEGLAAFFDPARLVCAGAPHGLDALWAAEEALRSGAAPLVVVAPAAPPALTPVRRLQLAAEAGASVAAAPPLCLILTPQGGSAAAVETRWRADPLPGWARGDPVSGSPARWRFTLLRDKAGPPGAWDVTAKGRASAPRPEWRVASDADAKHAVAPPAMSRGLSPAAPCGLPADRNSRSAAR